MNLELACILLKEKKQNNKKKAFLPHMENKLNLKNPSNAF